MRHGLLSSILQISNDAKWLPEACPHSRFYITGLLCKLALCAWGLAPCQLRPDPLSSRLPPPGGALEKKKNKRKKENGWLRAYASLQCQAVYPLSHISCIKGRTRKRYAFAISPARPCVRRLPSLRYGRLPPLPVRPQGLP